MKRIFYLIIAGILLFILNFSGNLFGEPTWGQHYYMGTTDDIDVITGDTSYILDNSTKKLVFRFTVTNASSVSIDGIRLRVKTGDDAHVRIETVDASGNPTGTLVDANAEIDYTSGNSSEAFSTFTLNGGTTYAIVITRASTATTTKIQVSDDNSGNFNNLTYADGASVGELAVLFSSDGSTYSKVSGVYPVFALRNGGTGAEPIVGTPFNFGTSGWTTNSLGVGEMFECPAGGLTVSGVYIAIKRRGTPPQIPYVVIDEMSQIDISGASVSSRLIKGKMNSAINDAKWWFISFPTNITLTGANNYSVKVMVENYDSSLNCLIFPGGGEWYDYANIVTPPSDSGGTYVRSGYAISMTNGNWGPLHADSSSRYDADICFKFRLVSGTLAQAGLVSPTNNAVLNTQTPTLSWNSVTGADYYEVFISSNSSLKSNWIKYYTTVSTQQTIDVLLNTNVNYCWGVRSVQTNSGSTSVSEKRSFIIRNIGASSSEVGEYSDSVSFSNNGLYWGQMYIMNSADTITSIKSAEGDVNANNYILDNSTEKLAFIFAATNTTTVDRMRIRLASEGSGYAVRIRLETVSNGIPTGNLADTNSYILSYASNTWTYFYNNADVSLVKGNLYAIVISKVGTSDIEIQGSSFADNSDHTLFWNGMTPNSFNVLYSANGTNFSQLNIFPIFAMRGTSGVPNVATPFNFGTSAWTTNSYGIGEVFQPGSDVVVSGVEFYAKRRGTPPHYVKILVTELSNINAPDKVITTNVICELNELIADKKWFKADFSTNITFKAGTPYALKLFVDSLETSSDCIIFPAGAEWYDFTHVVPNGYAITLTNGHWGTLRKSGTVNDSDAVFKFRVVKSLLTAPILTTPDNAETVTNDVTPKFKWNSVAGATHYEFYITAFSNINNWFDYYNCGNNTEFEIPESLQTNRIYFWRVRAVNSNTGATSLSEIRRVRVVVTADYSSVENTVNNNIDINYFGMSDPFPNIFDADSTDEVTVYFKSPESGKVELSLYNVYGKLVKDIKSIDVVHGVTGNISFIPAELGLKRGVYFLMLKTPVSVEKRKIFVK